ncbi:hypothetical protein [Kribbella sp. NPDC049227]|uniref:hypothetical protein n=1 Tax=Kribbella sp. NPDC049227 TaxID=3364113 RepID=UPI003715B843
MADHVMDVDDATLMSPVPNVPENRDVFRMARLLLLLDVARTRGRDVPTIDRLGYYEFLADSPFIVVQGDGQRDDADRLALELAGFTATQLAYASSGQRFASRRRRLQYDLARLLSYGLVAIGARGFVVTTAGAEMAANLNSVYADAYRVSAEVILRRLAPKSNVALEADVNKWLGESWLLIDFLDDVAETAAPTAAGSTSQQPNRANRGPSGLKVEQARNGTDEIEGSEQ